MGDGSGSVKGFYLYTNSFTDQEVRLLANVLSDKFRLVCLVQIRTDTVKQPFILYIHKSSVPNFISLVKPFFIPSMLYKLDYGH